VVLGDPEEVGTLWSDVVVVLQDLVQIHFTEVEF
jgi:hypothetical protein